MTTHMEVRPDGCALITLDNAPVNTLAFTLVQSMLGNLEKAAADPKVKAIVLTGKGSSFCGGAAVDEFAKPGMNPMEAIENLQKMINTLDGCPKPTCAAINGVALGGGCEVTLGCHYRVATEPAKLGFPEVLLGILPGAQGTQRAPRIMPFPDALTMIMTGAHTPTKKAKKSGLLDLVVSKEKNIVDAACEFVLSKGGKTRPISKIPPPKANKIMAKAGGLDMALLQSDKAMKGMIAPQSICNAIAAAMQIDGETKTFEEGCQVELNEFMTLVMSKESAGLRNVFFSERAAAKVVGAPKDMKGVQLKKVGVIGAGLMGGGIAMCFVKKGIPVVLKDAKQEWLDAGMKTIEKNYSITVSKGKMKKEKMMQMMSLYKPTLDYADFKDVDMIIEAVPEIMSLKKEVFTELGKVVPSHCIVCTNTSGLDIDEIATAFPDPTRVMGAHFFSPANVMQLLENVRTAKASMNTIVSAMNMGKLIGKKAILVGNCDGFIGNRMLGPYGAEAQKMLMEGAAIDFIDETIGPKGFGVAMGPISMADMVGLDLFWKARKAKGNPKAETKVSMGPFDLGDWLCENGQTGQKAAKGMFTYDAKTRKKIDVNPDAAKKIEELRSKFGYKARAIKEDEVIERMMYSLVNEGFKILEEGFAQRPSDIDIAYIYGYGHPPVKGGPMHWADNWITLPVLLEKLKQYDAHAKQMKASNPNYWYHDYFVPSKLLETCVAENTTLVKYWAKKEKANSKM